MLCNECHIVIIGLEDLRTWAGRQSVFLVDFFGSIFWCFYLHIFGMATRTLLVAYPYADQSTF